MSWPYTYRWEKRSKDFLRRNPLCRMCRDKGRVKQAEVVDHIIPHKGNMELFWDEANNWQSLCASHHSREKQSVECRGYDKTIGIDGWPIDSKHPVNRK